MNTVGTIFETPEDRKAAIEEANAKLRAWDEGRLNIKAGAYVVMRSGYGRGESVRKVLKVTSTQIVTDSHSDPLRFRKDDGSEVGGSKYYRAQLVRFATPAEAVEHERQRQKAAEKAAEVTRLADLCQRATDKLKPILGPNVKVMRWTTREDGTPVFKVEVENMTEEQVQAVLS